LVASIAVVASERWPEKKSRAPNGEVTATVVVVVNGDITVSRQAIA
jgi:hypothetical protein